MTVPAHDRTCPAHPDGPSKGTAPCECGAAEAAAALATVRLHESAAALPDPAPIELARYRIDGYTIDGPPFDVGAAVELTLHAEVVEFMPTHHRLAVRDWAGPRPLLEAATRKGLGVIEAGRALARDYRELPSPFLLRAADRLYDACSEAVRRGRLDARSPIGDATLDYRELRWPDGDPEDPEDKPAREFGDLAGNNVTHPIPFQGGFIYLRGYGCRGCGHAFWVEDDALRRLAPGTTAPCPHCGERSVVPEP